MQAMAGRFRRYLSPFIPHLLLKAFNFNLPNRPKYTILVLEAEFLGNLGLRCGGIEREAAALQPTHYAATCASFPFHLPSVRVLKGSVLRPGPASLRDASCVPFCVSPVSPTNLCARRTPFHADLYRVIFFWKQNQVSLPPFQDFLAYEDVCTLLAECESS